MVPLSYRAAALISAAVAALLTSGAAAQAPVAARTQPKDVTPPLDPDSPMAPLPDLGIAWPVLDPASQADTGAPTPVATDHRYRVVLNGLPGADPQIRTRFNGLSALIAGENKVANAAQIDRRARQDEAMLQDVLRAAGYYDADVETNVRADGSVTVIDMTVTPGRAYSFASIRIDGLGSDSAGRALGVDFAVKPGDIASADRVGTAVANFRLELGRHGYPFAQVSDPQVAIDHETARADLVLPVTLGDHGRFGRILVSGARPIFSARHLAVIARFHPGDPYDSARMEDFRRALINTGLVAVATVAPKPSGAPGVVDVDVHLERAPPRTVSGEFGYGTGEGARAEVSWQHRNLLPPEGSVAFRGILGTREQSLIATLRRSNFHARDHVLTAQAAADHSHFDAYDARTLSLSAGIERQTNIIWQKKWSWSLGGEFLASDERDTIEATGEPRRRTFLVAAIPGVLSYDASDDLLNPTRGIRLSLHASPEANLRRGVSGYAKLQGDASAYLPAGDRVVFAGRVRIGVITGIPRDDIAPSRRFYAGGGGSVRGYSYQKIGPVDVNGDPIGGRGLAEAAVEARVRFGNIGIVPFLDAGNLYASPVPKFTGLRYGTGIGARYYTSFGPIRIDVGTPIARRRGESKVAVYVSLGQAF